MKRPSDMNVRMRPMLNGDGENKATDVALSQPHMVKTPPKFSRRPEAPVSQPRRQIWDLEGQAGPEAPAAHPQSQPHFPAPAPRNR